MSKPLPIPITRPWFDAREGRYLARVLRSGWVTQGEWTARLEREFAAFTGAACAVAVNSCASAQMLAARLVGLGPGDEAVVPAFTWISTANSVELLGAKPVFADIDPATFNVDPLLMERAVGRRTRALLPVHLFGCPADLPRIMRLARGRSLAVIEDCACSLGAFIGKRHSGTFGDCGCFSLHPRKSITTGEGGMLVTGRRALAEEARALRNHGAETSDLARHRAGGAFLLPRYRMLGFNLRMSDLQGAVGVAQMEKLPAILKRRGIQADRYAERLAGVANLTTPVAPAGCTHGWQAYVCRVGPPDAAERGKALIDRWHRKRNRIMRALESRGIATRQGTHAVHLQEYYRRKYRLEPMDFPRAYAADRLSLTLPLFHALTAREQERVIGELRSELEREG